MTTCIDHVEIQYIFFFLRKGESNKGRNEAFIKIGITSYRDHMKFNMKT